MFNASIVRSSLVAVLAAAAVIVPAQPAFSAQDITILGAGSGAAIPGRYIVVLKDTARARMRDGVAAHARLLADRYQGEIGSVYERTLSGFSIGMSEAAARRLAADPDVDYIEQDQVVRIVDTQENPPSPGLDRIDQRALPLDTTYSFDPGPSPVTAYIIDTGLRITHTDIIGRATWGWDFVDGDLIADDCHGHGTRMAGILAGKTFGVAKSARVIALRAFNCSGTSTQSSVQSAVEWVTTTATKPAVVNLSIGIECKDASGNPAPCPAGTGQAIKTAISSSIAAGINYVVAAGNQNINACGSPFNQIVGATTVGSADTNDGKSSFSNWGSCVDIWSPGQNIVSSSHTSDTATATRSGTSSAAPHVTGTLALILTRPGWANKTPAEVQAQLLAESTSGVVTGLDAASPNKLVYTSPPPVAGGSSVALARNADGRLTLFGVNSAGTLFVRSQTQANPAIWSPWTPSVDPNWYSVCADTDSLARIKLEALRRTQDVWHRSQAVSNANAWTAWRQFDGLLNSCAVAFSGTKLEFFGTNGLGQVWHRSEFAPASGTYTPWAPVGGVPVLRSVAAERNGNGLVELFGLSRTGDIWHCWETVADCAPAGSWIQLDGQLSRIAVARNNNGLLSVFGVNAAGQLFHRPAASGTNNWFSWSQLDVPTTGGLLLSVAAQTGIDGRIHLVAVNLDGQIWHRTQTAVDGTSFGPWTQIDGLLRP